MIRVVRWDIDIRRVNTFWSIAPFPATQLNLAEEGLTVLSSAPRSAALGAFETIVPVAVVKVVWIVDEVVMELSLVERVVIGELENLRNRADAEVVRIPLVHHDASPLLKRTVVVVGSDRRLVHPG